MNRIGLADPNFILLKGRQQSLKKHYEKLREIQSSESKHFYSRTTPNLKSKTSLSSDRKQEITRNNKILLERITSITQRKPDLPVSSSKQMKSLNLQKRREQVKKINQENELMAERLRSQQALILKKNLDKDFEKSQRYREQVSKKKLIRLQANLKSTSPLFEPVRAFTPYDEEKGSRKSFTQRGASATPLPAPVPFVNRNEFEFSLESDSSYSEHFEEN